MTEIDKKYSIILLLLNKEIIDTIIKMKIYLIFISSEFVFREIKAIMKKKLKPINLYGKQKLIIEKYLTNNYKIFSILRIALLCIDDITDKTLISNDKEIVSKNFCFKKQFLVHFMLRFN